MKQAGLITFWDVQRDGGKRMNTCIRSSALLGALELLYLIRYAYVIYTYMVIQERLDTRIVKNNISTIFVPIIIQWYQVSTHPMPPTSIKINQHNFALIHHHNIWWVKVTKYNLFPSNVYTAFSTCSNALHRSPFPSYHLWAIFSSTYPITIIISPPRYPLLPSSMEQ